ncbi:hypothetical protein [Rheinheimera soli]|uniref:hypothetical protein n=1 Tax=Rheinheimera soli TaxID=443616 RepID=UPI001E3D931C|nr:hypothetical protein [Rheinheimera soli]
MTTAFAPVRRGTILIPSGPVKHLHFVCSDVHFSPHKNGDKVLLVNISTIDPDLYFDTTCILKPGEHPFVKHDSFIYYRYAELYSPDRITDEVIKGNFDVHQPCTEELMQRILDGFQVTREVKRYVQKFYEAHCK